MNGAESLIGTLIAGGVETCFTNPGTSEMHIVAALDRATRMRCVLALFEGVVTGAADGYARMREKPACTLLHLGPGLANGLANLHNAKRAQVPIVNIVGQHATYHLEHDTPLNSDIEGIAKPYSHWLRTSSSASAVGRDAVEAILAARTAPGQISTMIVPADVAWSEGGSREELPALKKPALAAPESIERAASMLRSGSQTAILLTGNALYGKGLETAGTIAVATGAKLLVPYPFARLERGANKPAVERIPYVLEQAIEQLKDFRQLILVGAPAPIAYFAYPDKSSIPTSPQCDIQPLAHPGEDFVAALEALAASISATGKTESVPTKERPAVPNGQLTLAGLATAIGALLPENCIVVDESMTSGRGIMNACGGGPPHDWLANTGGSIGIALPLAVGAAVARPDRFVLCLTADGSGMYTLQGLWTIAREGLKVTTVVFANRAYAVLKREFAGLGAGEPGARARDLFEIGRPDIDWVHLAQGMGIPARRVSSLDEFSRSLREGFESGGPSLIEVPL